jgi:hypothetical protein
MDHFYDGQMRRYLTQFIRVMSNFSYKDAKGNLTRAPVRYGDMNRQVAAILSQNSENIVQSCPFIACYIKDIQYDRDRLQDPTYTNNVQIRERARDDSGNLLNIQGENYTVERIMPVPYTVTFNADIWTSNTEQKLQLWEQLVVLFNPSLEIQTTDNFLDWTSISLLEMTSQQFESRSIPQGLESDISICSLSFKSPVWITPPAKVKKLGIITKIINNVFEVPSGTGESGGYNDYNLSDLFSGQVVRDKITVTPGNRDLLVMNNIATLLPVKNKNEGVVDLSIELAGGKVNWKSVLDLYPGQFQAGISQLRLTRPDGGEIVARVSLSPVDDFSLMLDIDTDTTPTNTEISGRGTVDAIVDPQTYNPTTAQNGTRYLILEDVNLGTDAWGQTFSAHANDIIEFDGAVWTVVFDSYAVIDVTYITNAYTKVQYKWDGEQWSKSFEGIYDSSAWRLIL